jgi:hypothetical protein
MWSGLVWSGLVWSGLVWSGLVWSGLQTLELPAEISMRVIFRKEVASLDHLGWTRQLVRETCVVEGIEYGASS